MTAWSPHSSIFFYETKYLGGRAEKTPARAGLVLKKKDLPNNKEILGKTWERSQSPVCRALHREGNGSPGGADVVHYAVVALRNALYPDLASRLIALKTKAVP